MSPLRWALVVLLLAGAAPLHAAPPAPPLYVSDKAFLLTSAIWKTRAIPVCWENPAAAPDHERDWVRDAIARTWERYSDLEFTGWRACSAQSKGIRIFIDDDGPHTKGLGNQIDGRIQGMVLNHAYRRWDPVFCGQAENKEFCVRVIAVHEFGHALGFAHEQNRPDSPATCRQEPQGGVGDVVFGAWDLHSVMNYCNPDWTGSGILSTTDLEALQRFYGKPRRGAFTVELTTNKGRNDVYFYRGQRAEILVKVSQPATILVEGISEGSGGEVAYLLEQPGGTEQPSFKRTIAQGDIGKWISLGQFDAIEPYGKESLQVIAVRGGAPSLPSTTYNPASKLYVIASSAKEGTARMSELTASMRSQNLDVAEGILTVETRAGE